MPTGLLPILGGNMKETLDLHKWIWGDIPLLCPITNTKVLDLRYVDDEQKAAYKVGELLAHPDGGLGYFFYHPGLKMAYLHIDGTDLKTTPEQLGILIEVPISGGV